MIAAVPTFVRRGRHEVSLVIEVEIRQVAYHWNGELATASIRTTLSAQGIYRVDSSLVTSTLTYSIRPLRGQLPKPDSALSGGSAQVHGKLQSQAAFQSAAGPK